MRALVITGIVLCTFLTLSCAKQLPMVMNFEHEPIPASVDGKPYSLEVVQKAILKACRHKGWAASVVEEGKIIASLTIRSRHRAKISISFTSDSYSILYLDSTGLNYRNGRIHSRYNHWISRLDAELKKEFGLRTQRF